MREQDSSNQVTEVTTTLAPKIFDIAGEFKIIITQRVKGGKDYWMVSFFSDDLNVGFNGFAYPIEEWNGTFKEFVVFAFSVIFIAEDGKKRNFDWIFDTMVAMDQARDDMPEKE